MPGHRAKSAINKPSFYASDIASTRRTIYIQQTEAEVFVEAGSDLRGKKGLEILVDNWSVAVARQLFTEEKKKNGRFL